MAACGGGGGRVAEESEGRHPKACRRCKTQTAEAAMSRAEAMSAIDQSQIRAAEGWRRADVSGWRSDGLGAAGPSWFGGAAAGSGAGGRGGAETKRGS